MKTHLTLSFVFLFLFVNFTAFAQVPTRVGWWKFDDPADMLKAEIGSALELAGTQMSIDGPVAGNMATQIGIGSSLMMTHGIAANLGGTLVNEYSLQIDFSVPEVGIWHAFFQTDPSNIGDADMFANSSSNAIGVSATGYSTNGIAAATWYRMVVTVRNGEFFKIYVNGTLWLDATGQVLDGRYALADVLVLFGDDDGEDGTINCSEVGIWDVALEDYEVTQLGDSFGDRVRVRTKVGSWLFDDSSDLLKAEIGSPLELVGTQESVPGPETGNLATKIGLESYLKMTHGIALNGEDTLVNEYSIQMDFSAPEAGIWHAFFQTDSTNATDADLFTNGGISIPNTIGTATTGYSTNAITINTWYRMIISVKNGSFFKVYLNGELWLDAVGQPLDGRFGLEDLLLLFADNDGDDGTIMCSELNIWEVALTQNEVYDLGIDPSNKIPERMGWWKFDDFIDLLKPEIGSPLELTGTQESTTGPINGNNAVSIGLESYFTMNHGISFNGGGSMVNEYSLQIDFSVPEIGIWHAFFQTNPLNGDDADLFINGGINIPNTIGTATTGYSANTISSDTWYRMIVSVKNGVFFKIYINGELWVDAAGQGLDGRFALADALLLFSDDDGDDGIINCSEAGIWDIALTPDQIAKLGNATTSPGTGILDKNIIRNTSDLGQNYPNPFSYSTTFPYQINKTGNVSFRILDLSGREIEMINEGLKAPGKYNLELYSNKLTSGIYYFQMTNNNQTSMRKMIVVR